MKQIFTILLIAFAVTTASAQTEAVSGATEVTVVTGANYADEVYWGFGNKNHTVARNTWDIAFTTTKMDISILANNGNSVMLFTYPKGAIADWATVDTTGMVWNPLYNSIENWETGAFVQNSNPANQFDYGWGVYNMSSHNIVGDSIYIIKVADNDFRKLAIVQKNSIQNQWSFKYAKLDGTDEKTVNFDADDYVDKKFIHYSIVNNDFVVQEPKATDWQLLFTRYYDTTIPYYVTGVLAKQGVGVQEVRQPGLNQETFTAFDENGFTENIGTIGSDWKSFSMSTFSYVTVDTVVYFVRELPDGDVWKLYFTGFSGSSTGEYKFMHENLTTTGVRDVTKGFSSVYPNPVTSFVNVIHDIEGESLLSVYNMSGQLVYTENVFGNESLNKQVVNVQHLPNGIYNVVIKGANKISSSKFIKR